MRLVQYLIVWMFSVAILQAHQSSLSLIELHTHENTIRGNWKIELQDLSRLMDLDSNHDKKLVWKELKAAQSEIFTYVQSKFQIFQDQKQCLLRYKDMKIDKTDTGVYAYLPFTSTCNAGIKRLDFHYNLLFEQDLDHKAYMHVVSEDKQTSTLFTQNKRESHINLKNISYFENFMRFIEEGIWHIWIGFDHILFLLALLLPSAFVLKQNRYEQSDSFKLSLINAMKIVTAFTIAHSITLSLSVLGFVSMRSWLIESIIAASVIFAALNNIWPLIHKRMWVLVIAFGFIHGLGFASVLQELGLSTEAKIGSLIAFNLGVELGQLAIVLVSLPLIYVFSQKKIYQPLVLKLGSFFIILMGSSWLLERLEGAL